MKMKYLLLPAMLLLPTALIAQEPSGEARAATEAAARAKANELTLQHSREGMPPPSNKRVTQAGGVASPEIQKSEDERAKTGSAPSAPVAPTPPPGPDPQRANLMIETLTAQARAYQGAHQLCTMDLQGLQKQLAEAQAEVARLKGTPDPAAQK